MATVVGAGVQGHEHLRLLPLIRELEHINVCSLRFEDARKLAALYPVARATADVEAAVREADIVCLAAHSPAPVIEPEWVKPGAHVSSVGFTRRMASFQGRWRGSIAFSSRRSTHFSRHRSVAVSSRASTPPLGRRLGPWRSAESPAA